MIKVLLQCRTFLFLFFTFDVTMHKFAIIGCGRISSRHAENISTLGQLVAVCDIVSERAETIAKQHNCKAFLTIDSLLEQEKDIDIVSVCTPNGFHAEHAIKSLQAGKHVLCETPLCITSAAAWQIIETEKFSRKKIFVVTSTRYNSLLQDLKKLIDDNLLGHIYSFQLNCFWHRPAGYYAEWRGKKFPDGGTLYTQFSHYIDAILWLLGDMLEVKGFIANAAHKNVIEFEDTGVVAVRMQNNILGTINWSVNTFEKNAEIGLTIIAEKGTVCLGGEYLNELKYYHFKNPFTFQSTDNISHNHGISKKSMKNHKENYIHLIKAVQSKNYAFTNSFDGLKTVETIERIYNAVNPSLPV